MAKQTIDVGTAYDDPSADKQRDANVKINANFTELYLFDFTYAKQIGAWNMSSTGSTSKQVAYEAPSGYVVAGVYACIIGDDGVLYTHNVGVDVEAVAVQYDYDDGIFTIFTSSAGFFYGTNFNDSEINRGYLIITLNRTA
jgi:hypothetical protein